MIFLYVFLGWLIVMIANNIWEGKKEKEQMTISRREMKKYFNGRFYWR